MKFKKEEILLLVLALIIGLIGGYFIFSGEKTEHFVNSFIEDSHPKDNDNLIVNEAEEKTNQKEEENIKEIKVYITGSIKNPGVYTMKDGDRIIDLFQKAGGESIGANLEQINMASHIKDGEKIYIPNLSEGENNMEQNENNFYSSESKININFFFWAAEEKRKSKAFKAD